MSRRDKLIQRFLSLPGDFTWRELVSMLKGFGYEQVGGGKTGGSRVKFVHQALPPIGLHRPHPATVLKRYRLEQIAQILGEEGLI